MSGQRRGSARRPCGDEGEIAAAENFPRLSSHFRTFWVIEERRAVPRFDTRTQYSLQGSLHSILPARHYQKTSSYDPGAILLHGRAFNPAAARPAREVEGLFRVTGNPAGDFASVFFTRLCLPHPLAFQACAGPDIRDSVFAYRAAQGPDRSNQFGWNAGFRPGHRHSFDN